MIEQLWVVDGLQPVMWTLPVRVKITDADVELRPALELRKKEARALSERLSDVNAKFEDGRWVLTIFKLRKIGREVPEDEPERHCVWHRQHLRERSYTQMRRQHRHINEFTDSLFQQGFGQTREEVAFWWQAFRTHMVDQLLNKGCPVDLGFVRLHSSLRRWDWLHLLKWFLAKNRNAPAEFRRLIHDVPKHGTAFHYERSQAFVWLMQWVRMMRMNLDGSCQRRIEVEHPPHWRKLVMKVESHRLKVLKAVKYAETILAELKNTVPLAAKLAAERRGNVMAPSARILRSGDKGAIVLAPASPLGPFAEKSRQRVRAARADFDRKNDVRLSFGRRPRKARGLQKVRDVRTSRTDLWNGGTCVPGLGQRGDGD